jgi:hypothetical protein
MMPLFLTPALAPDLICHGQAPDKSGQRRQIEQKRQLGWPPHVSTHNLRPHPQDHGPRHHNRDTPRLFGRSVILGRGRFHPITSMVAVAMARAMIRTIHPLNPALPQQNAENTKGHQTDNKGRGQRHIANRAGHKGGD